MTSRTEKRSLFGDILAALVKAFRWIVVVVLIAILCSGIRTVQTGEVAIILRFGRLLGDTREEQIHEPGLLFAFPYIIDEVITVPTGKVFELTVDTHNTSNYMSPDVRENGYIITGDQNIALVSASREVYHQRSGGLCAEFRRCDDHAAWCGERRAGDGGGGHGHRRAADNRQGRLRSGGYDRGAEKGRCAGAWGDAFVVGTEDGVHAARGEVNL